MYIKQLRTWKELEDAAIEHKKLSIAVAERLSHKNEGGTLISVWRLMCTGSIITKDSDGTATRLIFEAVVSDNSHYESFVKNLLDQGVSVEGPITSLTLEERIVRLENRLGIL